MLLFHSLVLFCPLLQCSHVLWSGVVMFSLFLQYSVNVLIQFWKLFSVLSLFYLQIFVWFIDKRMLNITTKVWSFAVLTPDWPDHRGGKAAMLFHNSLRCYSLVFLVFICYRPLFCNLNLLFSHYLASNEALLFSSLFFQLLYCFLFPCSLGCFYVLFFAC